MTPPQALETSTPAGTRQVIPPCEMACPAGIRVRDYVALIAQGRFQEAISLIRKRMPLASACGRICYHPCEQECNRGLVEEPIGIMHLKRFASDYEFFHNPQPPPPPLKTKKQRVAIIGAGPCGLTAAQDLAGEGYPVALFEALAFAGGTLRLAIARYRLPQALVDWDIEMVLSQDIELKTNTALGRDLSLPELQQEGYGAILLATGADRSRKLSRPEAGIFAEGDMAFGHMWTVEAVAAGHRAARTLSEHLAGGPPAPAGPLREARRPAEELDSRVVRGQIRIRPRSTMPLWQKSGEALGVAEIEVGYSEEMAIAEARRCLCCGSAEIDPETCISCLTCLRVCPYEVPVIDGQGLVRIREDRCQACGICVGECPVKAIAYTMPGLEDLVPQMEAALRERDPQAPAVIALYCSYGALDPSSATEFHRSLPPSVMPVPVPCLAKIDVAHLVKAFELGADGVVVAACTGEDCQFDRGSLWAQQRVNIARRVLGEMGLGEERLRMQSLSAQGFAQFGSDLAKTIESMGELGPSPIKARS